MRQKTGFMTREGALALIQLGEMYRGGQIALPPEIIAKKKEIEAAIQNAELFMVRLRVVDESMVNEIVRMKRELDDLYALWGEIHATRH